MKIYQHPNEIESPSFGCTIGNFDGVHLGHLAMLAEAQKECEKRGLAFAVITFFPHPLQILKAMRGFLICGYEKRRELLKQAGVKHLVEIPFTRDFSTTPPNVFITEYIKNVSNLKLLCLGYDFAFGANKGGNALMVEHELKDSSTELLSLCEFRANTSQVSSSLIREKIRSGDVQNVKQLLGRNFILEGTVVRGKGRGKGIGFPTANLQIDEEVISPSTGVYATRSTLHGKTYPSVTNVGFNPTFNDNLHMSIETNIAGKFEDFYEQQMKVEFLGKIREEKRFSSIEELKSQIAIDAKKAMEWKID